MRGAVTVPAGTLPAGAALLPPAPAPTTVGETPREGGDDPVRRRELLVGLVGVTGTAVFGAAARPATARAAAVVQELPPQLTGALWRPDVDEGSIELVRDVARIANGKS